MQAEHFHILFGLAVNFFLLWGIREFIKERIRRGMWLGIFFLIVWNGIWLGAFATRHEFITGIIEWIVCIFLVILLIPASRPSGTFVDFPEERVDERDVMFARAARIPGSRTYDEYYRLRPHFKAIDDHLRSLPGLCSPKSLYFEPEPMKQAEQYFEDIGKIVTEQKIIDFYVSRCRASSNLKQTLKDIALELGAVDAGIAVLHDAFIYTHKGRFDSDFGKEILLHHSRILVFVVEMNFERMQRAPYAETILESAMQYYRAAKIAKYLEGIISALGYDARAQYDAHYEVILPPLAVLAGLGEIGRNNLLISREWGARVRIGGVITNLPMDPDQPVFLNVEKFCKICKKCALSCPSRSLLIGEKEFDRGVKKWITRQESCYAYWRRVGTDCGICMAHCPYSKPATLFHHLIRKWIAYSRFFPYMALWMDDLIYGRKWKPSGRKSSSN